MIRRPLSCLALSIGAALLLSVHASAAMKVSAGLDLGTNAGLGGQAHLNLSDIAVGLPLSARWSAGYWRLDPGDPLAARHVFINANDNGDPTTSGHRWDLRLDLMRAMDRGPLRGWWLSGGPRFSMFQGDYDFVGGNETFFITSNQWGMGLALGHDWPISSVASLTVSGGLDWYAKATLKGHDSSYSPNGNSVSPVDNYTWQDADAAIRQPRLAPNLMLGIQRRFGN